MYFYETKEKLIDTLVWADKEWDLNPTPVEELRARYNAMSDQEIEEAYYRLFADDATIFPSTQSLKLPV